MQFGVQFFPAVAPEDKSASDYFEECLAIAAEAETLGYSHARTVEHYFRRYGGYSPNPLLFLAAASQRTKTMRLVTGAVVPAFNNPLKLAGEIAMLDAMSQGRLDVGFARAFLPHEFRRFKISPDESVARFREGVEQIGLLLTTEHATHSGQFHSFEDLTSLPRPTQQPRPKFYIASTRTPDSFEFAGRSGHALMAIPIGPIKPLLDLYRKAWREAGHPGDGEVMIAFHMFCHQDARAARDIPRRAFDLYFEALVESAGEWTQGTTFEGLPGLRQVDRPHEGLFSGRPDRDRQRLYRHARRDQGHHPALPKHGRHIRACFAADQFRHAGFCRGAKIDAAVRPRGDAGTYRWLGEIDAGRNSSAS